MASESKTSPNRLQQFALLKIDKVDDVRSAVEKARAAMEDQATGGGAAAGQAAAEASGATVSGAKEDHVSYSSGWNKWFFRGRGIARDLVCLLPWHSVKCVSPGPGPGRARRQW